MKKNMKKVLSLFGEEACQLNQAAWLWNYRPVGNIWKKEAEAERRTDLLRLQVLGRTGSRR